MNLKIKRKYFQIYIETEGLPFDGRDKTTNTLRAAFLQTLAMFNFREVIFQPRAMGYEQNVVRVNNPEAEVKWGISCEGFYLQVSVSDKTKLEKIADKVLSTLKAWTEREA